MVTDKVLKVLEFDKVRENVSKFCMSQDGKNGVLSLQPTSKYNEVQTLLQETYEADRIIYTHALLPELSFDPIGDIVDKSRLGTTLSMLELLRIARVLKLSRNLKNLVETLVDGEIIVLRDTIFSIGTNEYLENDIARAIISENEMSDNASTALRDIRKAIATSNVKLRNTLNRYITNSDTSKYLRENLVTIRGGRYVIPLKSECKGQIGGLVHDQSASGQTIFVEPFDVVQLNNDLTELKLNENREIERILREFSVRVTGEIDIICNNERALAQLDTVFAKAKYCHANKCNRPIINSGGELKIIKGRHPLIAKEKVIPIDLDLLDGVKVLLITGPNTGGKTVSLKLVGLFSIMAMSGIFPSAEYGSIINIYDCIFADIGDMQSIENSLSTFSSHLSNIIDITDNLSANSLVLLDELGGGTDPNEGAALAVAVLDEILTQGATAIITTHYRQLKDYALQDARIKCAAMDFDAQTYAPSYRLIMNSTGGSKALQIAKRLGLKQSVLSRAISAMSPDTLKVNEILDAAERAKSTAYGYMRETETAKSEINAIKCELKKERDELNEVKAKLNDKLKRESGKLMRDYEEAADEILEEIKELIKIADENALFQARKLKAKMLKKLEVSTEEQEAKLEFDDTPIMVGDKVLLTKLNKIGETLKIDTKKGQLVVKLGGIVTNAYIKEVRKIVDVKSTLNRQSNVKVTHKIDADTPSSTLMSELNVRGQTVDEAIYNIDTFINNCVMQGYNEVRIVHGKGTGALRKAVSEHFRSHPNIKSYRLGKYGEGDDGVTIATLK